MIHFVALPFCACLALLEARPQDFSDRPKRAPDDVVELSLAMEQVSRGCQYDGRRAIAYTPLDDPKGAAFTGRVHAAMKEAAEVGDASFLRALALHNEIRASVQAADGKSFDSSFSYAISGKEELFRVIKPRLRSVTLLHGDRAIFYQSSFDQLQLLDRTSDQNGHFYSPRMLMNPIQTDQDHSARWMRDGDWSVKDGSSEWGRTFVHMSGSAETSAERQTTIVWPSVLAGPRASIAHTKFHGHDAVREEWDYTVYRMRPVEVAGVGRLNLAELVRFEIEPSQNRLYSYHYVVNGFQPLDPDVSILPLGFPFRRTERTTFTDRRKGAIKDRYGSLFETWPAEVKDRFLPL